METGKQIDLRGLEGARRLLDVAASTTGSTAKQLELRSAVAFWKALKMDGQRTAGARQAPCPSAGLESPRAKPA